MQKDLSQNSQRSHLSKYWIFYFLIVIEAIMIVLYSIFVQYGSLGSASHAQNYNLRSVSYFTRSLPIFQDINVMIFVGFGFLFSYLNKYSWSGIAISYATAAWTIQMGLLTNGWWFAIFYGDWVSKISVNFLTLTTAQFTTVSALVASAAVLGKLNFAQHIVMATFVTLTQPIITFTTDTIFFANDLGGAMTVFLYGTVFGLSVALVLRKQESQLQNNFISRSSALFALIGTLFLWVFWPSWNAVYFGGNLRLRAHLNTILSLTGSCILSFFVSVFTSNGKFCIKHIFLGTISGGVIMGSISESIIYPWVSFFIGCCSGAITVVGLNYITPRMKKGRFQDSTGVLFTFGIPGFLSGIISAIIAGTASLWEFGANEIQNSFMKWGARSRGDSAGFQLAVIGIVLGLAIVVGSFTGAILNSSCFDKIHNIFDDLEIFHSLSDNENNLRADKQTIEMQNTNVVNVEREKTKQEEPKASPEERKELMKEEPQQIKQIEIQVNAID